MTTSPGETIKTLKPGRFTRLCRITPAGTLEARLEKTGAIRFYWRGAVNDKTVRVAIGLLDRRASPKSVRPTSAGYSIAAATQAAVALADQHIRNRDEGGLPAIKAAQQERKRKAQAAEQEAAKYTTAALLRAYCDYLASLGRAAHRDARSIFELHIVGAFPQVAAKPAAQVTDEDVADMMRALVDADKARTANKMRSYLRAAFEVARRARLDAGVPLHFKNFGIRINPGADALPVAGANRPDKNPLDENELREYWKIIKALPGLRGALLRLHLLTGGQRIAQLVRLRNENIAADGTTITLYDGKGRPGTPPRPHMLPLVPAARKALDDARNDGVYALSTDGGMTHVAATTLSKWAQEAAGATLPGFTAKRIRSGVETLLSRARVSKEVRGRLQSHGIAGVQDRHYDGNDYLPAKKQALMTLYRVLEQKPAQVISIEARAK